MTCCDINAWKIKDKDWLKSRKAEWKIVNKSLKHIEDVRKAEIPIIKAFFIFGEVPSSYYMDAYLKSSSEIDVSRPFQFMTSGTLLELWLTADRRGENLKDIIAKYGDKKRLDSAYAMRILLKFYPKKGSVLSGFEQEICQYLQPAKLKRDDYPGENINLTMASQIYGHVMGSMINFLEASIPNTYHFGRYCLADLKEILEPALQKNSEQVMFGINKFIELVQQIIPNHDKYDPLTVEVTQQMLDLFDDPSLPAPILDALKDVITLRNKQ